jgi:hypothetical protein
MALSMCPKHLVHRRLAQNGMEPRPPDRHELGRIGIRAQGVERHNHRPERRWSIQ